MLREASPDPYTKFRSAGKLARTVARWKTRGIDAAVSDLYHAIYFSLLFQADTQGKINYAWLKNKREMVGLLTFKFI